MKKNVWIFLVFLACCLYSPTHVFAATGTLNQQAVFTGEASGDQFGYPNVYYPITVADINEDGKDDILVGGRYHDPLGGFYIFLGKEHFADTSAQLADIIIRDDEDTTSGDSAFGEAIGTADVDGDGHLEIMVSNYRSENLDINHDEGAVYIFKAGKNFSSRNISQSNARIVGLTYRNTLTLANTIGDFNGDGYDDLFLSGIINDYKFHVYYGAPQLTNKTILEDDVTIDTMNTADSMCSYNRIVAEKNDVNGDGYDDIVMTCPFDGEYWGKIYIFFGSSHPVDRKISEADVIISAVNDIDVGYGIATGDINDDGIDDIIATGDGITKAYVFFGSHQWQNMSPASADKVYSLHAANSSCNSISFVATGDINNDQKKDVLLANSSCGDVSIFYGGKNISEASTTTPDLIYDGPSDYFFGNPMITGEVHGDGYRDLIVSAGTYNNKQGRVYLLGTPHGTSSLQVHNPESTNTSIVTGTVTDTLGVGGVELSLDNGNWSDCSVSGENFTCTLTSTISDGSHSIRVRNKNQYGIYIPPSDYKTLSITSDKTLPQKNWQDPTGNTQTFQSLGEANAFVSDQLPTFEFVPASDTTSGISRYQILIDGNIYLDEILPQSSEQQKKIEDEEKSIQYETTKISVRAKSERAQLVKGKAYKWKVRALDKAGNSLDTEEKIIRVDTHQAVFSGTFFPLSLLNVGEKSVQLSTTNVSVTATNFSTSQRSPTFFGIAPVNAKITARISEENKQTGQLTAFTTLQTQANSESRFGMTLDKPLEAKKTYCVFLSATNDSGDYVELPEFSLTLSSNTVPITTAKKMAAPSSQYAPAEVLGATSSRAKRCIWMFCW